MSGEKVLLIGGDGTLAERVCELLNDRVEVCLVDPRSADLDPEGLYGRTFDFGASAVVLIEPIRRQSDEPPAPDRGLLEAALRAARSPLVTGFGWVTSHCDENTLDDLRSRGKPFGVLRPSPVLDVRIGQDVRQRARRPVLVEATEAQRAADARCLTREQAAGAVARWIADEGMRRGGNEPVLGAERPMEEAVRDLGFEPLVLPRWRVGLNRALGMTALERGPQGWTIRRRSWLPHNRSGVEREMLDAHV